MKKFVITIAREYGSGGKSIGKLLAKELGVSFYSRALTEFNDLYQYFAVLSAEKRRDCEALLDVLLSEEVQGALSEIGMFPVAGEEAKRTVSVFTDGEALEKLKDTTADRDGGKNLVKILKNI